MEISKFLKTSGITKVSSIPDARSSYDAYVITRKQHLIKILCILIKYIVKCKYHRVHKSFIT